MVVEKEQKRSTGKVPTERVIISEGAGVALTNVFSRLVKQKQDKSQPSERKRQRSERPHVVLTQSEEVQEKLSQQKEEKRRYKEAKRAKLEFERNGRVIPDASTGASHEKQLHTIALQGAVALFNAVSKAQKVTETNQNKKKKGAPVSKESFMDMMKAGISANKPMLPTENSKEDSSSDEEEKAQVASGAKWLNENYLTAGSKKLKDWDRMDKKADSESGMDDEVEGDNENDAESDDGEEMSDQSSEDGEDDSQSE